MNDCKITETPMSSSEHLDADANGKPVDQKLYRSMIGSLLYLCASRPNIMFSVCLCARFQDGPQESHLTAVKRILKYIKHTPSIGLWYPKGARLDLLGYSDSDFAGSRVDRKSTSGGCHLLGRSLVSWLSKKQKFRGFVHRGSGIYSGRCMLCPNPIYEANPFGLWCETR